MLVLHTEFTHSNRRKEGLEARVLAEREVVVEVYQNFLLTVSVSSMSRERG